MKIINHNQVSSLSASSENASYPVTNLILNASPKKKWLVADSSVMSATLLIRVAGVTGGLGMVGVDTDSAVVTVSVPEGLDWQNVDWPDVDWVTGEADLVATVDLADQPNGTASLWVNFPQFTGSVAIRIELTKNVGETKTIGAGVLVVGEVISFPDPAPGLRQGLVDYSTARELSNGAFYYRDRDQVRTFSFELGVDTQTYFYRMMRDIAQFYGMNPMMMLLVDSGGSEWVVYGRLASMPSGTHITWARSAIQIELIEVI